MLQDDSRELSRWLSTRLGARYQLQRNNMPTNQTPDALAQAIKDAVGEYANLIRMGHVADAIPVLSKLIADTDRLRDMAASGAKDAERYQSFFDAGLPITFLGVDYRTKEELDAAIDATKRGGA